MLSQIRFSALPPLAALLLVGLALSADIQAQDRSLVHQNAAERRVALVIGNGAYETAPLKNPVNDALDVAEALRASGFEVIYKANQDQNGMKRAIREFGTKIKNGGVGLFYYAGHGLQVNGANYLVPVDAKVQSEEEVEYETVDAGLVLAQMDSAKTSVNIVILDACRNNPFARSFRSGTNGLAQMDAPSGTLIAYATAPGSIASDGATGRNGLYTRELLKVMATPDLSIEEVLKRVRISVRGLTKGKQTPWEASSLTGNFSFRQTASTRPAPSKTGDEPITTTSIGDTPSGNAPNDNTSGKNEASPAPPLEEDPLLSPEASRVPPLENPEPVYSQKDVDQRPMITSQPKPAYTEDGRKNQIQGVVRLQVVLRATGAVGSIKPLSRLGYGLTEQAIAAARNLRFVPAMKNGKPVSVQVTLDYVFNLY